MTGGELPGYDDALAREIEARMEAAAVAEANSDELRENGVVVGNLDSPGEHTAEEVTSEEAGTLGERSVGRISEGEDNENRNREEEVLV